MNTTKKGDQFEALVHDQLLREIREDKFLANEDRCHIYKKKGYYSRDRKKKIIIDISIEIFLPGHDRASILVLVECKNYKRPVQVGDVESFFSKTQQISGGNIKAILITNNSFQEGTINFSESKGIGLAKYVPNDDLNWVLQRSPSHQSHQKNQAHAAYKWLREEPNAVSVFNFYAFFDGQYTASITHAIKGLARIESSDSEIVSNTSNNGCFVEYLSHLQIEHIANAVLQRIEYSTGKVDLNKIISILTAEQNLTVNLNAILPKDILGRIQFHPFKIYIDKNKIQNTGRQRFTLAHELGHYFLGHSRYILSESYFDSIDDFDRDHSLGISEVSRMELQANSFASNLLLPKKAVLSEFYSWADSKGLNNRGFGYLYLDDQKCNIDNYRNISSHLAKTFLVSKQAVKYRLLSLELLNEVGVTSKRINSLFK